MNVQKGRVFVVLAFVLTAPFLLGWVLGVAGEGAPTATLVASNSPPVAQDDAYTATAGVPLVVAAPGVLANDSDPDGDTLTATLLSAPAAGTLHLYPDGSFEYGPEPGLGGVDSFTYLATDGVPRVQAYWPFEEEAGDTTADASGSGYEGALMNGVSFSADVPVIPALENAHSLAFDGVDDYVDVLIDVSETAYAVSLWVKTSCDNCGIFSADDGVLCDHGHDRHLFMDDGDLCGRVWNGLYNQETVCTSGTDYADGTWHHVVHTFGGLVGGQRVYIDGQLRATGTQAVSDFDWQTGINIGYSMDPDHDFLDGLIDDVRLYPVALTQAQVVEAMNGGLLSLSDRATVTLTVAPDPVLEILMALYESTGGEGWVADTGWGDFGVPTCEWYGVTCDGGEIVQLDLSANNLRGTIPAALSNLSTLTQLSLDGNPLLTCWGSEEALGWARQLASYSGPSAVCFYVDRDATGADTGDSWADAFTDLQSALGMTLTLEGATAEIWVAEGVYTPTHRTAEDPRSATFQLRSGAALYGGFAGTESDRHQREWAARPTVLSGDLDGDDVTDPFGVVTATEGITGTNAWTVVTGHGVDATAVLDGFTITAGNAEGSDSPPYEYAYSSGGGMVNCEGSPSLVNVTFTGNSAHVGGGGMFNWDDSSPSLENVTFSGNSTDGDGGGMVNVEGSNPSLVRVTFSGNTAGAGGGMSSWRDSSPTLLDVAFLGNSAGGYGGGMVNVEDSNPSLVNVVFDGNSAAWGGGMCNDFGDIISGGPSSPSLVNVTFGYNSAQYGGAMANRTGSMPTLVNSILWGNSASMSGDQIHNLDSFPSISYSDIEGSGGSGPAWNTELGDDQGGNIDADALFLNALGGDLRLAHTSPAIDAGDNAAVPAGVTADLAGNPRFVDVPTVPDSGAGTPPIVDMGAYEMSLGPIYVDGDATGSDSGGSWADAFTELQSALTLATTVGYPNTEIWVAEGVYYPDYAPDPDAHTGWVTASFALTDGVAVYGGFDPGAGAVDWEQRDPAAYLTVLSGDLDRNDGVDAQGVVTDTAQLVGGNAWTVVTGIGVDATAVLDGFTITGGMANGTLADCNEYEQCQSGGGIYLDGSSPSLANLTLSGNAAGHGGGMFSNEDSNPTLAGAKFRGNSATLDGGAISNRSSSPTLVDVIFRDNSAAHYGGAVSNRSSDPTLMNATFWGHWAGMGGVMANWSGSRPALINATIGGNSAGLYGGVMYNHRSSPTLVNCILWGNSAATAGDQLYNYQSDPVINYSLVQGGCPGGATCDANLIVDDPLFLDATVGDLQLRPNSPAIDAGDNSAVPPGITTDLRGRPRILGGAVDMGAYETPLSNLYLPLVMQAVP